MLSRVQYVFRRNNIFHLISDQILWIDISLCFLSLAAEMIFTQDVATLIYLYIYTWKWLNSHSFFERTGILADVWPPSAQNKVVLEHISLRWVDWRNFSRFFSSKKELTEKLHFVYVVKLYPLFLTKGGKWQNFWEFYVFKTMYFFNFKLQEYSPRSGQKQCYFGLGGQTSARNEAQKFSLILFF